MRAKRTTLLCLLAALAAVSADSAFAQKIFGRGDLVPNEVVIEVSKSVSTSQVEALQRRFALVRLESRTLPSANTTVYRWRIPDRRSVTSLVRSLKTDRIVASAQPNYLFALADTNGAPTGP